MYSEQQNTTFLTAGSTFAASTVAFWASFSNAVHAAVTVMAALGALLGGVASVVSIVRTIRSGPPSAKAPDPEVIVDLIAELEEATTRAHQAAAVAHQMAAEAAEAASKAAPGTKEKPVP